MARPIQLSTFDLASDYGGSRQAEAEEARLATYEEGYAAGWDDAIFAQNADIARLRADLGRNLADMTLNYRDAQNHLLNALEPLLRDMVTKVLPTIAHQTLGPMILDEIRPVAHDLLARPVVVRTSPENAPLVETTLAGCDMPLTVRGDDTLGPGQALVDLGQSERCIDLDRVIGAIDRAVQSFFHLNKDGEAQS